MKVLFVLVALVATPAFASDPYSGGLDASHLAQDCANGMCRLLPPTGAALEPALTYVSTPVVDHEVVAPVATTACTQVNACATQATQCAQTGHRQVRVIQWRPGNMVRRVRAANYRFRHNRQLRYQQRGCR